MKTWRGAALLALVTVSGRAHGYEHRMRFVERIGTNDVLINGNLIDAHDRTPRRIRVQVGVFEDATSVAPPGGLLGWNVGTITVNGPAGNSDETRTNGRIAPWNFAQGANSAWNVISKTPPIDLDHPGSVIHAPDTTEPAPFAATLLVYTGIPAPTAAGLLSIRGLALFRRRRTCSGRRTRTHHPEKN